MFGIKRWMCSLVALLTLLPTAAARSEEPAETRPIAVVSAASVDRVLAGIKHPLALAGREDLGAFIEGLLGAVGNLEGMDRTKPVGALVYFSDDVSPQPVVIVFIPVTDINKLKTTVALGPIRLEEVKDKENRYTLVTPDKSIPAVLQGNYLYLTDNEDQLDRTFPDPAKLVAEVTPGYDLSGAVVLKNVPEGLKTMALDYLRAEMASKKRNHSTPQEAFELKMGEETLKFFEQVLEQGEQLTFGLKMDTSANMLTLETKLQARPGTPLATATQSLGSHSNQFAAWIDPKAPASLTITLPVEKRIRTALRDEIVRVAEDKINDIPGDDQPVVKDLLETIQKTLDLESYQFAVQILGEPPDPFMIAGAIKIAEGKQMAVSVEEILKRLVEKYGANTIERSVAEVNGIAIHSIVPEDFGEQEKRLYGEDAKVYLAITPEAVWFTLGTEQAQKYLEQALNQSATEKPAEAKSPPVQLSFRASNWMGVIGEQSPDPDFVQLATKSFGQGGDEIRFQVLSADEGVTIQLEFEEGYLRLLGHLMVKGLNQ